ncbi:hypothetical protein AWB78_06868 [Caballeronia calidae]|uniref:Uncharacterized protein n=1 Tax=Caballeronia calidae TaxID=1777139 RepID=A0A158EC09_9BURK|nr:hypothetical protein [Caballeronia calidae]SAL04250.1 hypothetical protein AWB78_06868 [Caballeronia calidae]
MHRRPMKKLPYFFTQLRDVKSDGIPDPATLARPGTKWRIEFLGPPLTVDQ